MADEKRHIILCSDPKFALGTWIAIWSAWKNTPHAGLQFHWLTKDLSDPALKKLVRLAAKHGIPLDIHNIDVATMQHLPIGRYSLFAYVRLMAPELLPDVEKFLYMDADILVRHSIAPLYDTVFSEPLAAVRDYGLHTMEEAITYFPMDEPTAKASYFNSGILLVNATAWRNEGVTKKVFGFLDQYQNQLLYPDQEGVNGILANHIHEVDFTWNIQLGALDYFNRTGWPETRQELKRRQPELLSDGNIVHFIGKAKPWTDGWKAPYGDEYRAEIFASGWLPKFIKPFWILWWFSNAIRKAIARRMSKK